MKVAEREVNITHPDKLMFPGISKKQVIDYYIQVAPYMLPLIKDRPIVLQRYPNGINGASFYQKEASEYFPEWIKTITVELIKGGQQHLVMVNSAAALAYLANQAALTFHTWLCTRQHIHQPDRMVFDLDPSGDDFNKVKEAALVMRQILTAKNYDAKLMTTGSRGLHVVVPLKPGRGFEAVHKESQAIAAQAAQAHPDFLTTAAHIADRDDKIYLDVARNSYGQTQVAPYSLRARPGAPLAAPITWEELANLKTSQQYNIQNISRRLAEQPNPWQIK